MHVDADSIPDTPTISFTNRFKRVVNFLNLRKNIKIAVRNHATLALKADIRLVGWNIR